MATGMDLGLSIFSFFDAHIRQQEVPVSSSHAHFKARCGGGGGGDDIGLAIFQFFSAAGVEPTHRTSHSQPVLPRHAAQVCNSHILGTRWTPEHAEIVTQAVLEEAQTGQKPSVKQLLVQLGLPQTKQAEDRVHIRLNITRYNLRQGRLWDSHLHPPRDRSVNYAQLVIEALLSLQDHQGTLLEVCDAIWANPTHRSQLDLTPIPCRKTVPRWRQRVLYILTSHKCISVTGTKEVKYADKRGRKALNVYQLDTDVLPTEPHGKTAHKNLAGPNFLGKHSK